MFSKNITKCVRIICVEYDFVCSLFRRTFFTILLIWCVNAKLCRWNLHCTSIVIYTNFSYNVKPFFRGRQKTSFKEGSFVFFYLVIKLIEIPWINKLMINNHFNDLFAYMRHSIIESDTFKCYWRIFLSFYIFLLSIVYIQSYYYTIKTYNPKYVIR